MHPSWSAAPPAPTLLKNWSCSDCNVSSIVIAQGEMRVCPKCYALLWHIDYSTEAQARRSAEATARELERLEAKQLKHKEFLLREARRKQLKFSAENLSTSSPVIEAPTLMEKKDDV
jgi:hypothetical protein